MYAATRAEYESLFLAIEELLDNGCWDYFVEQHRLAFVGEPSDFDVDAKVTLDVDIDHIHNNGHSFLNFHRRHLFWIEEALSATQVAKDKSEKTGTLPCIRFPQWDLERPPSKLGWARLGGYRDCIFTHPLNSVGSGDPSLLKLDKFSEHYNPCHERKVSGIFMNETSTDYPKDAKKFVRQCPVADSKSDPLAEGLYWGHAKYHGSFGGAVSESVTSPVDPLFYILHVAIDRMAQCWNETIMGMPEFAESCKPNWDTSTVVPTINDCSDRKTRMMSGTPVQTDCGDVLTTSSCPTPISRGRVCSGYLPLPKVWPTRRVCEAPYVCGGDESVASDSYTKRCGRETDVCPPPGCGDNGMCVEGTCECEEGYTGDGCEIWTAGGATASGGGESSAVIYALVGIFVIIIGALAAVCLMRRRQGRRVREDMSGVLRSTSNERVNQQADTMKKQVTIARQDETSEQTAVE